MVDHFCPQRMTLVILWLLLQHEFDTSGFKCHFFTTFGWFFLKFGTNIHASLTNVVRHRPTSSAGTSVICPSGYTWIGIGVVKKINIGSGTISFFWYQFLRNLIQQNIAIHTRGNLVFVLHALRDPINSAVRSWSLESRELQHLCLPQWANLKKKTNGGSCSLSIILRS